MDFSLTPEQKALREEIIQFARTELNEGARERDRQQLFPRELWDRCGAYQLQGLPVPKEYGGRGLDPLSTVLALEALGYGCTDGGLLMAISAHLLACVVPVWKHGNKEQQENLLPRLCRGELIMVNAMSEPDSGSDAFAMEATAEQDSSGYFTINGHKTFGSNAPVADLALVYAVTDREKRFHGGITAFLVRRDTPGFQVSDSFNKMGLRTCLMGETRLENVRVGPCAVLGSVGGGVQVFTQSMEWERICLVACHIGAMERLLEVAIKQARTRKASGKPIGSYQAISHKIADMKVRLEAARLLTYRAASRLDKVRNVAIDASMAKLYTSESLIQTALEVVQIFGARGILEENDIERTLRDSIGSTIYSGTSEIQRNIIARWLGLPR